MLDIFLKDGDISLSEEGDIILTESVRQAARVRLQWFLEEWRLGPKLGLPYFEEVFIKNPNIPKIKKMISDTILEIDNVDSVTEVTITVDSKTRAATVHFTFTAGAEVIEEEVALIA